jgi:hypothetical protein
MLKPMFPVGGVEQLCNDVPRIPFTHMPFEKCSFPDRSLSYFFETGENFLYSIGKVVRHAFHKYLFHIVVEAKEDIGCVLGSGITGAR